jgi:hypothetical protein
MALHWNVENVKDADTVCFYEEGSVQAKTQSIIFGTMYVGIPRITEKTADEFFSRISEYERVTSPLTYGFNPESGKVEDLPITREDVEAHIGLSTNASRLTKKQFKDALKSV